MLDLINPEHLAQALGQVDALPGSDTWVSIVCSYHSPLQHLNQHPHGESYKRKLKQNRKQSVKLLCSAEKFIAKVLSLGGRAAFDLPAENELWKDPQWMKFESDHSVKRVFFNGCSFNLRGKGGELIKKPSAVLTSDMRLIRFTQVFR